MSSSSLARAYRRLRLRLPARWSRGLARLAYMPKLLRGHEQTRRELIEERLIGELVEDSTQFRGIGRGLSERVVEIPWSLRQLSRSGAERVLDVGTAFAPPVYKWLLVRQPQRIELVDLADAEIPGLRGHVADVRDLPFEDAVFDLAICISTLEHIGMDNAQYGVFSGGDGDVAALRELGRVARRVLVTVPGGGDRNMGWQRQYSPATFRRVIERAGLTVERMDVFAHDPVRGWEPAPETTVGHRTYGEGAVAAAVSICAEVSRR